MRLHHVALGAHDVERVADFYRSTFETREIARHFYPDRHIEHEDPTSATPRRLRAIWLDLGDTVLMVEHTEAVASRVEGVGVGPFLLAFRVTAEQRRALEARLEADGVVIDDRTSYTSYVRDPEGNRVGFSHFPEGT